MRLHIALIMLLGFMASSPSRALGINCGLRPTTGSDAAICRDNNLVILNRTLTKQDDVDAVVLMLWQMSTDPGVKGQYWRSHILAQQTLTVAGEVVMIESWNSSTQGTFVKVGNKTVIKCFSADFDVKRGQLVVVHGTIADVGLPRSGGLYSDTVYLDSPEWGNRWV